MAWYRFCGFCFGGRAGGTRDEPPTFSSGMEPSYIDGVGKVDDRLLILLNLHKMFITSEGGRGFAPD
jgi:chemotaxis signal transduction protein